MRDVSPQWHKSTFCGTSGCVEVAQVEENVLVRDSKRTDSPVLSFTADEWSAFVRGVMAGEFTYQ